MSYYLDDDQGLEQPNSEIFKDIPKWVQERMRLHISTTNAFQYPLRMEEIAQKTHIPNDASYFETQGTSSFIAKLNKSLLMDISMNREWIAYVTDGKTLNISKFLDLDTNTLVESFPTVSATTQLLQGNMTNGKEETSASSSMIELGQTRLSGYFLSVSSNGKRVALSSMDLRSKTTESKRQPKDPRCLVFKVSTDGAVDQRISVEKELYSQGRAVFLDDCSLALINKDVMEVYNVNKNYEVKYWINLTPLMVRSLSESVQKRDPVMDAQWSHWDQSLGNVGMKTSDTIDDNLRGIINMTKYITDGILTTYSDGVVRLWNVKEGGMQLLSFFGKDKEVTGISKSSRYVARLFDETGDLGIYQTKTGLLVNKLVRPHKPIGTAMLRSDFASFHCNDHFLVWISFIVLPVSFEVRLIFELWSVSSQSRIYQKEFKDLLPPIRDWKFQPCIIEKKGSHQIPIFQVLYSTLEKNGGYAIRQMDLDVYSGPSVFNPLVGRYGDLLTFKPTILYLNTGNYYHFERCQVENRLNDGYGLTSYKMICKGTTYLLRFGAHTAQLWRLSSNGKEGELIYIRAFKPVSEAFTQDFDYKWIRFIYKNSNITAQTASEDYLTAYYVQEGLRQTSDGRFLVNVCLENMLEYPKTYKNYFDEVHIPMEALLSAEDAYNQEKQKSGKSCSSVAHQTDPGQRAPTEEIEDSIPDISIADDSSTGNTTTFAFYQFECINYHYIESAFQALHYLWTYPQTKRHIKRKDVVEDIALQTRMIVERTLKEMKTKKSNYFTTISGSNTLAMLASFEMGRMILFSILKTEELPISLFSYTRKNAKSEKLNERKTRKENALTVLIEKLDYQLYHLLFIRVVAHSKKLGVGSFSALTDTLLFLQERGAQDVLAASLQKLSFLEMNYDALPILETEAREKMYMFTLHKDIGTNFRDLVSHSSLERIPIYKKSWSLIDLWNRLCYWLSSHIALDVILTKQLEKNCKKAFSKFKIAFYANFLNLDKTQVNRNLFKTCAVPFLHFNTYDLPPGDEENNASAKDQQGHKIKSTFLELALDQHENDLYHQQDTVLEVLLQYKWKTFIRRRFLLVYSIHIIYYITYSIGVLFALEAFNYTNGDSISGNHLACIILMFISGAILFLQEIRQFLKSESRFSYFTSLYNYFDMAVVLLPVVTFWQMRCDEPGLYELESIATIFFWIHGILRLRAIAFIGITLETIIKLVKSIYKLLFILLLVMFGFTNAFIVLLSHKDDSFFQENFSGATNQSQSVDLSDVSSSNSFSNPFKAFSILWFCVYGVWDPLKDGDAGDDYLIMILSILFSFITILIFFNLVIALMSSKAEEVKKLGESIWVSHFAAVIAEIEQLWCLPSERHSRKNNPNLVFYVAKKVDIERQNEIMQSQIEKVMDKLKKRYAERSPTNYFDLARIDESARYDDYDLENKKRRETEERSTITEDLIYNYVAKR